MKGKYVLIEHGEPGEPHLIRAFASQAGLERATEQAIFGPSGADNEHRAELASCLASLREDGVLSFEGDPSLQWMRANVVEE